MSPNNHKVRVTDQYVTEYQIIHTYLLKLQRLECLGKTSWRSGRISINYEKEDSKGIPGGGNNKNKRMETKFAGTVNRPVWPE